MSFVREHAKQREKQLVMAEVCDNEPEEIPPTPTDSREHLEQIPAREETPSGLIEYESVTNALTNNRKKDEKKYTHYTNKDRYKIGRYASQHGSRQAARKFSEKYTKLNESTVRGFLAKYKKKRAAERAGKEKPTQTIAGDKSGRQLMLGPIDRKVQAFLLALRKRGGVVNTTIAIATATALIESSTEEHLKKIKLTRNWAQSLFRRMKFTRRVATTAKVPIPEKTRKEIELVFMHRIVQKVEKYSIPPSLIINIDQTPTKYVPKKEQSTFQSPVVMISE